MRIKMNFKVAVIPLFTLGLGLASAPAMSETGQNAKSTDTQQAKKKTKRVPSMRNRVYAQLARAQQIADDGDVPAGMAVLDKVKQQLDGLNSYEQAMLFNFYGFMHYGTDNTTEAINNFEKVVALKEGISDSLYLSTQFSLAQLYMQQQDFEKTEQALQKWKSANTKKITPNQHVLFAQVYYQQKKYDLALNEIDNAIKIQQDKKESIKENWLVLKRAAHFELKQPEMVTRVLEDMVRLFNKPQYWIQLSGMYGEIGQEDKQLAVMEAAFHAGFVDKQDDLNTLAQLYLYHQLPYKAATLLEQKLSTGELDVTEQRLELLAQSYLLAKEDEKAIPVLIRVSKLSETGKYDAQLAQVYTNLEKWTLAIESADHALERGGVENTGDMHLARGIGYFNLEEYDQSMAAFSQGKEIESSKKMATQWHKYVKREQGNKLQLAQVMN